MNFTTSDIVTFAKECGISIGRKPNSYPISPTQNTISVNVTKPNQVLSLLSEYEPKQNGGRGFEIGFEKARWRSYRWNSPKYGHMGFHHDLLSGISRIFIYNQEEGSK